MGWALTLLGSAICSVSVAVWADVLPPGDWRWNGSRSHPLLTAEQTDGTFISIDIASRARPVGYRGPYAFYRLATALGSLLVPPTELRAVPLRRLLGLFSSHDGARAALPREISILNDGTVTALFVRVPAHTRTVRLEGSDEARSWRAWAASASIPSPEQRLVGSYVETLILDYLAGNPARSSVLVEEGTAGMVLVDNELAFMELPDQGGLNRLLTRLKAVTAFPRAIIENLRAFDELKAQAALRADRLVPPRPIMQMMERRSAVLSLVEARRLEFGDQALRLP